MNTLRKQSVEFPIVSILVFLSIPCWAIHKAFLLFPYMPCFFNKLHIWHSATNVQLHIYTSRLHMLFLNQQKKFISLIHTFLLTFWGNPKKKHDNEYWFCLYCKVRIVRILKLKVFLPSLVFTLPKQGRVLSEMLFQLLIPDASFIFETRVWLLLSLLRSKIWSVPYLLGLSCIVLANFCSLSLSYSINQICWNTFPKTPNEFPLLLMMMMLIFNSLATGAKEVSVLMKSRKALS